MTKIDLKNTEQGILQRRASFGCIDNSGIVESVQGVGSLNALYFLIEDFNRGGQSVS